jgi:peptide-methionine (S)-S-oxide reductase
MDTHTQRAIFAGGCFWCTEAVFQDLKGVVSVTSGYVGGSTERPTYEQVSSGKTGHAEAIEIVFDPEQVSYKELLYVFFYTHNPTTPGRQGNDVGTQYRSAIFYTSEEQRSQIEEVMRELEAEKVFDEPVVTEVLPEAPFYSAEEYHQNYFKENPEKPYCQIVIFPKVEKLRAKFSHLLKDAGTV